MDLTLAKMPDQKQAKAASEKDASTDGPRLGLNLAPAKDVGGAGSEGVAVVGVDPNGPASERGIKTGDVILDVGGKAVANVADVRKALTDARSAGKSSILLAGEDRRSHALRGDADRKGLTKRACTSVSSVSRTR